MEAVKIYNRVIGPMKESSVNQHKTFCDDCDVRTDNDHRVGEIPQTLWISVRLIYPWEDKVSRQSTVRLRYTQKRLLTLPLEMRSSSNWNSIPSNEGYKLFRFLSGSALSPYCASSLLFVHLRFLMGASPQVAMVGGDEKLLSYLWARD